MMVCPDCDRQIPWNSPKCLLCEWQNPNYDASLDQAPGSKVAGHGYRGQCAYEHDGVRCPLPGANLDPGGSIGWCTVHIVDRGHGPGAAERLEEILADPDRFGPPRIDWRDAMVRDLMSARADRQRQPGEGRSEYQARMAAEAESLRAGANGKMTQPAADMSAVDRHLRASGRAHEIPADAPRPSQAELVEESMDQFDNLAARYEAEGIAIETAQRMAAKDVLTVRLRA